MEILENFGFDPVLFTAQIVNFLILFFLMKKFLYKPLLKVLEDRKNKIAEGLENAEKSNKLLQETIEKEENVLRKAREEAKKMINQAKAEQAAVLAQTEEATKARVNKMLEDAREQINLETANAQKKLTAHVNKIAVDYLNQAAKGMFTEDAQENILKNAITKLKKKAE